MPSLSISYKPQACRRASNERQTLRIVAQQTKSAPHLPSPNGGVVGSAPCLSSSTGKQDTRQEEAYSMGRRGVLLTSLTSLSFLIAAPSQAGNDAVTAGLDRYMKKKKMDSIDTYVPQLLEAKNQLVRVERVMLQSPDNAREMLRSGVFKSIRRNIKAVGDYVGEQKSPEDGSKLITGFFSALESLDGELLAQSRTSEPSLDVARQHLSETIEALNNVIDAVPSQAVSTAEKVLQAVEGVGEEAPGDVDLNDPELTKLRKLL